MHGAILETWTDLGAEQSSLGYPVTDEGSWISPISVRSRDDGLAVNYIVLNAGHASWDEINKALHDIGRFLAEKGAAVATAAVGTAIGASVGSGSFSAYGGRTSSARRNFSHICPRST